MPIKTVDDADADDDESQHLLTLRHTHNPQPSLSKFLVGLCALAVILFVVLKLLSVRAIEE